jgi:hypothetical protein
MIMATMQTPGGAAPAPTIRLLVRERGSSRWHEFRSVPRAAQYALLLDERLRDRVAFPVAIYAGDDLVWGSYAELSPSQPAPTLRELAAT